MCVQKAVSKNAVTHLVWNVSVTTALSGTVRQRYDVPTDHGDISNV